MSIQGVESVLSKAISDSAFASKLFSNADQALAGFDLTAEEVSNLKGMSRTDFDAYAKASPEDRKSFGLQHNEVFLLI